jgi:hypothetical protein
MNEITKEQMLEAIDDAFKTWDEGSFYHPEDHGAWDAIRSLIEASGEKESGEAQTEDERRVDADKALWPAPSPGPSTEEPIQIVFDGPPAQSRDDSLKSNRAGRASTLASGNTEKMGIGCWNFLRSQSPPPCPPRSRRR